MEPEEHRDEQLELTPLLTEAEKETAEERTPRRAGDEAAQRPQARLLNPNIPSQARPVFASTRNMQGFVNERSAPAPA